MQCLSLSSTFLSHFFIQRIQTNAHGSLPFLQRFKSHFLKKKTLSVSILTVHSLVILFFPPLVQLLTQFLCFSFRVLQNNRKLSDFFVKLFVAIKLEVDLRRMWTFFMLGHLLQSRTMFHPPLPPRIIAGFSICFFVFVSVILSGIMLTPWQNHSLSCHVLPVMLIHLFEINVALICWLLPNSLLLRMFLTAQEFSRNSH